MTAAASTTGPLTHGVALRPIAGEQRAGDNAVLLPAEHGVLVGVADGLGHGAEAAAASDAAIKVLTAHADESPVVLHRRCHEALRRTRGAAVSLATVSPSGTLHWVAVGNVQGAVAHADGLTTRLVTRGGVVGRRLPPLRAVSVRLAPRDLLVMFTDGVDEAAIRDLPLPGHPQAVADHLLQRYATGMDDALVLVARYTGPRP